MRLYSPRMNHLLRVLPIGLLFLAAAGEAPVMNPTRDVTVTYKVLKAEVAGGPAKLVIARDGTDSHLRIDSYIFADATIPYEGLIFDYKANRVLALLYSRQVALDSPGSGFEIPGLTMAPDMTYQRKGDETVAGMACTDWAVTPAAKDAAKPEARKAEPFTACVTADGVLLRSVSATREMEATTVSFDPIPAAKFTVPPDLKRLMATPAKLPLPAQPAAK